MYIYTYIYIRRSRQATGVRRRDAKFSSTPYPCPANFSAWSKCLPRPWTQMCLSVFVKAGRTPPELILQHLSGFWLVQNAWFIGMSSDVCNSSLYFATLADSQALNKFAGYDSRVFPDWASSFWRSASVPRAVNSPTVKWRSPRPSQSARYTAPGSAIKRPLARSTITVKARRLATQVNPMSAGSVKITLDRWDRTCAFWEE